MGQETSWRLGLRAYLAAALESGAAPTVGELVERFGADIQLHHASRKWACNHREKRANNRLTYPTAYRMRFYTLTQELHWLQCEFDPPGQKTYQTTVLVRGARCPKCGQIFVGYRKRPTHGTLCPGKQSL